ncbi:DNA-processing protein DprA [Microbacterium sp. T2.11-28]|uniref:DNA-processing protein DprA n=1 Tax=Microbacterium sp. T2.11-28 TaxID=3041169 RepID=UPI0024779F57|nr:DNA-processing protein DprA [Microbacterium sp. T2.11-28]CAI9386354.1 Putative DNA processing protein DprA [Microbacterium sp. T2.11-28]
MIDVSEAAVRRRTQGVARPDDDLGRLQALDARMLWAALTEPGDGVAGALVGALGAREALELVLHRRGSERLMERCGLDAAAAHAAVRRWRARAGDAPHAVSAAQRAGVRVLTPEAGPWPARLDDLGPHAPLCLWVRGEVSAVVAPAATVALVGARAATSYGEHVVAELAAELGRGGASIVSGGAYGIDGMAHRAALAAGAVTVAWLAGGVDRAYPAGHRALLDQVVASGGALVGEAPCGAAPTKWRFLARNRLIAAGSDATVVVEAGWRSGSLNTAGHAAALGRPLGAVPGPITSATSAGCHRLLREYAAQCITSADDVRELIGWRSTPADPGSSADTLSRVQESLSGRAARTPEELARRSGLDIDAVESALGLLVLDGAARRVGDGWCAPAR